MQTVKKLFLINIRFNYFLINRFRISIYLMTCKQAIYVYNVHIQFENQFRFLIVFINNPIECDRTLNQ